MALARSVHRLDGYPVYLPPVTDPWRRFLVEPSALSAWVAEESSSVVGHVALHRRSSAPVMELACASLDLEADRLAVVARMVVAAGVRRRGTGSLLLAKARRAAEDAGRVPVLDVVASSSGAVAFYERLGWRRLGSVEVTFDGQVVEELVYAAPAVAAQEASAPTT